jgi:SpoVK/Ycf46/Vps4 family AAA+-type ATPase
MSDLKSVIDEMKAFGYTDAKVEELLGLVTEEVYDQVFLDLATVATEEQVDELTKKTEEARFGKDIEEIAKEAAKAAYGDEYKEKLETMIADGMKAALEMTKNVRKLYHDYMSGDPVAKKKVEDMQNSEEYKKLQKEMEDSGFDFNAAAAG